MNDFPGFYAEFSSQEGSYAVVVEDDGRVAYAYLFDADGQIRADVWLYNRCAAPELPEWTGPDGAPFANPVGFVAGEPRFMLPMRFEDVSVSWMGDIAQIMVHDQIIATMWDGSKPGRALQAGMDGPLANVLVSID
ncbi:hypothetical protein BH09PSE6_BH09PSE6_27130 [soil metagenome]